MKYPPIARYDEWFVTRLLEDDGRIQGAVAIDLMTGRVQAITAKATILATGGCGRVFPFTTNANIKNGDGMALALRAGAPLKDMEFIQYHPTGLPFTGILITEAARAEGGYMVNKDGYRYLQDYDLGTPTKEPVLKNMELGPRDRLSQAFMGELAKGRTIDTEYGPVVNLDLRHLGEKKINERIPFVRELCKKYQGIDPVKEMVPVRPVVHYMMGGVSTDINGATPMRGLYAAGECACVSINGANRLGSNSLPECLVFGARAGKAAAEFAASAPPSASTVEAQANDEKRRLEENYLRKQGGTVSIAWLRDEMHHAMEGSAGIYREGKKLEEAAAKVKELRSRYQDVKVQDGSRTFNTELTSALEMGFMLDVSQTIIDSALARTESRGAHQRTDFKQRDDARFLKHSLVFRKPDGSSRIEYEPVKVTRWAPGERKYGMQAAAAKI